MILRSCHRSAVSCHVQSGEGGKGGEGQMGGGDEEP